MQKLITMKCRCSEKFFTKKLKLSDSLRLEIQGVNDV